MSKMFIISRTSLLCKTFLRSITYIEKNGITQSEIYPEIFDNYGATSGEVQILNVKFFPILWGVNTCYECIKFSNVIVG